MIASDCRYSIFLDHGLSSSRPLIASSVPSYCRLLPKAPRYHPLPHLPHGSMAFAGFDPLGKQMCGWSWKVFSCSLADSPLLAIVDHWMQLIPREFRLVVEQADSSNYVRQGCAKRGAHPIFPYAPRPASP